MAPASQNRLLLDVRGLTCNLAWLGSHPCVRKLPFVGNAQSPLRPFRPLRVVFARNEFRYITFRTGADIPTFGDARGVCNNASHFETRHHMPHMLASLAQLIVNATFKQLIGERESEYLDANG
jgi:hypothetical protein